MEQPVTYFYLEIKDWFVVAATLVGPILAVQAQKAVEAYREGRMRKVRLFEQLMSTRAARVSPEHVRALNMVDLVFYGARTFGVQFRSKKEKRVLDAWKEHLDHFTNTGIEATDNWAARSEELLVNLLQAMADDLGYAFDRVHLKRGAYMPIAHGELENENAELRRATLSLVSGKHALNMNVVGLPIDDDALAANKAAIQNVGKALESGVLRVEVGKSKE